ncbi:carbon starvation CstA family protein [Terrisporobacter mayombei]|uniref:carbon starvation CstA family protein n=1 Tax=Terrisporobacter mayombei TaxID=1541 RepID=UPI002F40A43F
MSIFPFLFTTIACGAISGFHATQSPMMARCINRESETRRVFFGSIIVEGIVALIWCAVTIAFFGDSLDIQAAGTPSEIVNTISKALLRPAGTILAVLGVVACPITSGDTAFISARLTIADAFKIKQDGLKNRFMLALPLFAVGVALTQINFDIIWRYFAWSNQTLAMIFLWTGAAYLLVNKKNYWIAVIPAIFMSYVSVAYILQAPEGFKLNATFSNATDVVVAIAFFIAFMMRVKKEKNEVEKFEKAS